MLVIPVRNPGNLIPHPHHFADEYTMCESAALELGCVVNGIRHVIVCGHSDCKAMNLLYTLRDEELASQVRSLAAVIFTRMQSQLGDADLSVARLAFIRARERNRRPYFRRTEGCRH